MNLKFYYSFTTIKTKFQELSSTFLALENDVRKTAEERYIDPMVEIDTVRKVGFRKYLVIWKVTGELIKT